MLPACNVMSSSCLQVIDEMDRLLGQSYQDWLPHVIQVLREQSLNGERVVKIIASATLTQDPAKLDKLDLCAPRYIAMSSTDTR